MRWQFVAGAGASDATRRGRQSILAGLGPEGGPGSPEIEELIVPSARLGRTVPVVWLACMIAACATVVGLGLVDRGTSGAESGGGVVSPLPILRAVAAAPGVVVPPPAPRPSRERIEILILLPGPGDVVLAKVVAVAGSIAVSGAPRGIAGPDEVRVTISDSVAILGEAALPVVDGRFVGWVHVVAPARGVVVEIRVSDARRADQATSNRMFVLQAGSADDGREDARRLGSRQTRGR
jgi:hypothetical protein